jgi:hypothetical protein
MLAAVLASNEDAVVSHRTAAELHGVYDRSPAVFDVTSPGQSGREVHSVRWHRTRRLDPSEVTIRERVPTTTVSRTLVDLAGMLGERSLRDVVEAAAVRRVLDIVEINRILARGRRRGASILRELLLPWQGAGSPVLRSPLEAWLLRALVEAGLPRPECNVLLEVEGERFEIDLLWRRQRLAIETDGEEAHGTPVAFQRDRRRDQMLVAAGYRTARVTWRQMRTERGAVTRRIAGMLGESRTP